MSDPKRATIITVGAPKSAKNKVTKTVRLTISLDESNESKYPELNYKELVNVEEKQKTPKVTNGKAPDLDPFSDNDDDVERAAKKFEQKYGGKSTYGRKGRSKHDEFADIGAGYDENDSFIDNTDGYDEMITPECDTLYGGFYINSGSLEFKTVPEDQLRHSDSEPAHRRNKRRISSSSSEDSSESSSESSRDVKEKKLPNGDVPGHDTEHRKKKIKKLDKKAKRIRRNDSSAATSGKQTSDDNAHADGESADSRTSQSDSLASKPAPSSENAVTSDSSRDISEKDPLPAGARAAVEALKQRAARRQPADPRAAEPGLLAAAEPRLLTLEKALSAFDSRVQKSAWTEVAKMFNTTRTKLCQKVALLAAANTVAAPTPAVETNHAPPPGDTPQEREAAIVDTLNKLKALIEEKTPAMMANYKVECERVKEERKKLEATAKEGGPHVERRMPKRRFPWCSASRALLARLSKLGGATLLAERALPLFPAGFARRPTLLRQADLKTDDVKRQRVSSTVSQPIPPAQPQPTPTPPSLPIPPPVSQSSPKNPITTLPQPKTAAPPQPVPKPLPSQTAPKSIPIQPTPKAQTPTFSEPIQFPSSLTVTTTVKTSPDKSETIVLVGDDKKESQLKIPNSITITKEEEKNEKYVPPNSIGSITITPVSNQKKTEKPKDGLIRVKTPAVLMKEANDIAKKDKDRHKVQKEKRVNSPLHIETNFQAKDKISPVSKKEVEDKIPRPGLIPVHLSPTFAKPSHPADKRPDVKKKKDILIVSDVDPLSDINSEPVAVDDSSSDVEVIEEKEREDKVPEEPQKMEVEVGAEVDTDIDAVMRNLREMQDSQEPNFTSSSFGSVIKSVKRAMAEDRYRRDRLARDKLSKFFKQNGWL